MDNYRPHPLDYESKGAAHLPIRNGFQIRREKPLARYFSVHRSRFISSAEQLPANLWDRVYAVFAEP